MSKIKKTYPILWALLAPIALLSLNWAGVARANADGSDTQLFNAALSGNDYITVKSARVLGTGRFSLGLSVNRAYNSLPYFDDAGNGSGNDTSKHNNDQITSGELLATFGVTHFWDLGIGIPYVFSQTIHNDAFHGEFTSYGNTGVRLTNKFSLWKMSGFDLGAAVSAFFDRTQKNPYVAGSTRPLYALEVLPEFALYDATLALNLGYRFRHPGASEPTADDGIVPINPVKNQTIASAGLKVPVFTKLDLLGEIYGSRSQNGFSNLSKRSREAVEGVVGARYAFTPNIKGQIGLGQEVRHAVSSADQRYYASIYWTTEPPREEAPPAPKALVERQPDQVIVVSDVLFTFNSAGIDFDTASKELARVGALLSGPETLDHLVIDGHTCSIGTDAHNLKLSRERAESVRRFLFKHYNVPLAKMESFGYGETRPISTNSTPAGRKMNRRVEFKFYFRKSYQPLRSNP